MEQIENKKTWLSHSRIHVANQETDLRKLGNRLNNASQPIITVQVVARETL